jgi:hypothetical protein
LRFPLAVAPVAIAVAVLAADASADPTASQPYTAVAITIANKARLDPAPTSDPTIALGGQHRLIAYTDYNGASSHPRTGWVSTINGGTAWQTGALPQVTPPAVVVPGNVTADTAGRPSVAWSPTGAVFMAYETDKAGDACDQTAAGIDLSVSTNAGTAATAVFGSTTRVAISNAGTAPNANGFSRTWPSIAVDGSAGTMGGQPLVAFASSTARGCSPGASPLSSISIAWPSSWTNPGAASWVPQVVVSDPDPTALDYPSLVAVPGDATTSFVVAYLRRLNANAGQIEAYGCVRTTDSPAALFNCGLIHTTDPFALARTAPILGGVSVTSAPSLAIGSDGSLHLAYTVLNAHGDLDVIYTSSDPTRQTWTDPVSVAAADASAADQFMPSVSVAANGRADVAYLDDRMDPDRYAAFQTSFRGGIRGDDVRLSSVDTAPPTVGSTPTVGSRMGSMTLSTLQKPYLGHLFAYWSQVGVSGATLYEGELWHGLSAPALAADNANGSVVAKNTDIALPASWFAVSDRDGDPVTLAVSAPAHGALAGDRSTYTPDLQFAGADAFTVQATDTGATTTTAVTHRFSVVDAAPLFSSGPASLAGDEGQSGLTVPVAATDPDPGDPVCYAASVAPALVGHVRFVPVCGPTSTMTIDLPRGYRPGIATIKVHARDSTPTAGGDTTVNVFVSIRPHYATPTVNVQTPTSGFAARLDFSDAAWNDPDADCAAGGPCIYHFQYEIDGGPVVTTTAFQSPVRSYGAPGLHTWRVRVWITTPTGPTPVSAWQSGKFTVSADPRAVLKVRLLRRGRRLHVRLTSKVPGTVRITLFTKGRRRAFVDVRVSKGVPRTTTLSLVGIRARSGSISLSFVGGFQGAGDTPDPLVRRVWLG